MTHPFPTRRSSDLSFRRNIHLPSGKNAVALQQKNTPLAGLPCRIDKSAVGYGEKSVHAHSSTPLALRVSTSRQAMRTATPISTCSVIADRTGSSATPREISTPRFIGPGSMTHASGLAPEIGRGARREGGWAYREI